MTSFHRTSAKRGPCDIRSMNHKSKINNDVNYHNFNNKIKNQQ